MHELARRVAAAPLICAVACSTVWAAPPQLRHFFPAGGCRGTSVNVTAAGTFDTWPTGVWVDRAGLVVEPAAKKGELSVVIDAQAEPGLYWVRFYTAEGASQPRPLVVGTLAEVLEVEPNNDPSQPQPLDNAQSVVNGRLAAAGDVDVFALDLKRGQTLVAQVDANGLLGSPMDAVLQVTTADGFVLEQNDDAPDLDPRVVYTAAHEGRHLVRLFAFPAVATSTVRLAGGDNFIYRLTLSTGGWLDYTLPLAVSEGRGATLQAVGWNIGDDAAGLELADSAGGAVRTLFRPEWAGLAEVIVVPHAALVESEPNGPGQAAAVEPPVSISGRIDPAGDEDVFRCSAAKGRKLRLRVSSRRLGFALDAVLRVSDAAGKVLATIDDVNRQSDPELTFSPPADGDYLISVADLYGHGGPRYAYRLDIEPAEGDFGLTVAANAFVSAEGKKLEIPVTVDRRDGFAGEIEIAVVGLPEHVKAAAVRSQGTGESAKAVKLVLEPGGEAFAGPIRIEGKATIAGAAAVRRAEAAIADHTARTVDIWLTLARGK